MKHILLSILTFFLIASCGGGDNSPAPESASTTPTTPTTPVLSTGLKIFVTSEKHVGDFANDPTLSGSSAILKADDFCNKSVDKPNNSIYKALLVDGITREATGLSDWVLQPLTTYYRPYDNLVIGTTDNMAIFTAFWKDLDNGFGDCDYVCAVSGADTAWTGIGDARDFSVGATCNGWSDVSSSTTGRTGYFFSKDGSSISAIDHGCSANARLHLICIEQPK